MIRYWDPLPTARRLVETSDRNPFQGTWTDRQPRNVPGPFYTADVDSMQLGRLAAPDHISYDDGISEEFGWEFVYHFLQQFRWEKDWPSLFGLVTGVNEGALVWVLASAGAIPGVDSVPRGWPSTVI